MKRGNGHSGVHQTDPCCAAEAAPGSAIAQCVERARAELRIFEESSHSIRSDEPQAFLDAIKGFVVYKH